MPDAFVPLAELLRRAPSASIGVATVAAAEPADDPPRPARPRDALLAEFARIRLAAIEAYERATGALVTAFARDVLARELLLAPADVAALAARALDSLYAHEPVALVVALGEDVTAFATTLPMRVDASLERGDLVVEVANGAFESPLAFRLDAAIDASLIPSEDDA